MTGHAAWLAQVDEATLEPERPIVDPHHHFWRRAYASYAFCPHYLLPELWEDTGSGHRIEQTVFIECSVEYREVGPEAMHPLGETEFVAEIATAAAAGPAGKARIGGIVGHADLRLGAAVEDVLVAQIEAGRGRDQIPSRSCKEKSQDFTSDFLPMDKWLLTPQLRQTGLRFICSPIQKPIRSGRYLPKAAKNLCGHPAAKNFFTGMAITGWPSPYPEIPTLNWEHQDCCLKALFRIPMVTPTTSIPKVIASLCFSQSTQRQE